MVGVNPHPTSSWQRPEGVVVVFYQIVLLSFIYFLFLPSLPLSFQFPPPHFIARSHEFFFAKAAVSFPDSEELKQIQRDRHLIDIMVSAESLSNHFCLAIPTSR